jgi:phage gpG-like protein
MAEGEVGATSAAGIIFDFFPSLSILVNDFNNFGEDVRSYKEPLKRSVQQVIAPAIAQNFASESGGGDSWEPLAESTIATRAYLGFSEGPILQRTGRLAKAAQQLNIWHIDREQAFVDNLPSRVKDYGYVQQFGGVAGRGSFIPARPFLVVDEDAVDDIVDVFQNWIGERLSAHGFSSG